MVLFLMLKHDQKTPSAAEVSCSMGGHINGKILVYRKDMEDGSEKGIAITVHRNHVARLAATQPAQAALSCEQIQCMR